ncbi:hypothetical protein THAOC_02421 [Thalassiosira oceanica]|uniref:Uncharacterized protein n=1 Tax=Thalassiosira oceanica TaxID=159749 RepID=K0TM32_THAOC|nr:hypothetical protein THAOC_02421 [Thalassiosira oceanica]|eukprot:EJK75841.1 hypothetical protein THAOC_02421 [Thalassiosira oceanica]
MNFFPARPAQSRDRPAEVELYRTIASRATDRTTKSLNSVAAISTEDIIANRAAPLDHPLRQEGDSPDLAIVSFRRCRRPAKVTRNSGKTARDWVASTSERTNRRPPMHRWLFEVDGGHGPTQWAANGPVGICRGHSAEQDRPRRRPEHHSGICRGHSAEQDRPRRRPEHHSRV